MIKVQDFATKYGVTDRQVQRLLKKYEDEMAGHYERQGPNGTWIDETGERILRSKMRQAPIVLHDSEVGQKIAHLEQENESLKDKLILALEKVQEQQALLDDGRASQLMLQAAEEQAKQTAQELADIHQQLGATKKEARILEGFLQDAKAEIAVLSDERDEAKELARLDREKAKKAQDELTAAQEKAAAELAEKDKKIQELENRTFGDYLKGWFRKKKE